MSFRNSPKRHLVISGFDLCVSYILLCCARRGLSELAIGVITRALRFGEPLPECGIAPVVRKELRKKRVSDFGSARHIVERGDHVKHGPRLELAEFSLRLVAHIVRCWPGIKDRVVPQAAVVRTAVAKIDDPCSGRCRASRI